MDTKSELTYQPKLDLPSKLSAKVVVCHETIRVPISFIQHEQERIRRNKSRG